MIPSEQEIWTWPMAEVQALYEILCRVLGAREDYLASNEVWKETRRRVAG